MKKIKFLLSFVLMLLVTTFGINNVFGVGATLSSSTSSILQGNTFTVRVSLSSDVSAANFNISYDSSKLTLQSGDTSFAWVEGEGLPTYTFKANSGVTGTTFINLSGNASDTNYNKSALSGGTAVNITAPVVVSTPAPQPATTTSTPAAANTTTTTKSANANLASLKVSAEGLSPTFNKNKTNYSLAVGKTLTSVIVTAIPEDSGAKVSVSGNTNLVDGDNTISILVTAPNSTKKTYTIIVNKSADPEKTNAYLTNLIIDNATINPAFEKEVLSYDCGTVKADVEKLEIRAFPENKDAKIEISGNDKLVDGENTIKIKVIAIDGVTVKEYTIKVIKEVSAISTIATTEATDVNIYNDDNKTSFKEAFSNFIKLLKANWLVLFLLMFCVFEYIQILYLYLKLKKINNPNGNNKEQKKVVVKNSDKLDIENKDFLSLRKREGKK